MPPSLPALPDTENTAWASDKTKFGYRMLQKMGWKEGKGLGVNENGVTEHIRTRRKSSLSGVGAAGKNAVWKVPGQVAAGLNDVLALLKPVETQPVRKEKREKVVKKRGYYERRRAGKCVGNYSKEQLREIFGGVEGGDNGNDVDESAGDGEETVVEGSELEDQEREKREREEKKQRKKERKERKKAMAKKEKKLKAKGDIKKLARKAKKEKSKR